MSTCRHNQLVTSLCHQVQPVDMNTIHDVQTRVADCSDVISSSPMIKFSSPLRRYTKSMLVSVPLPSPHHKTRQQRPKTAAALGDRPGGSDTHKPRPVSAFGHSFQQQKQGLTTTFR